MDERVAGSPAAPAADKDRPARRVRNWPALDGVRAIAILSVMDVHLYAWAPRSGFYGLTIFFVLSGFLITSLLLDERTTFGRIDLRRFYARRALRLLPALVALCAVFLLVSLLSGTPAPEMRHNLLEVAAVLGYVTNILGAFDVFQLRHLGHLWSLAIEEQFYFLWPIALFFALRRRATAAQLFWVVVAAATASTIARVALWLQHRPDKLRVAFGPDTRASELLVGCAAAILVVWVGDRIAVL